ncbi:DUF6516 family protein [Pseudomonas syringae]|uniref:DUF6516 family protein n=1 Tax=Pseudomonas syringae TaxID=317 RepID=UPI001F349215|nr:DUF6516 family protein [Pseudomonas syringae]
MFRILLSLLDNGLWIRLEAPIYRAKQLQKWNLTLKLNDVIKDCVALKLDGRATDGAIQIFGGNFLSEQNPVLPIEVREKEALLWMMQGADDVHLYIASGTFHINALYKPANRFPATRIYFLKTDNMLMLASIGVFLEQNGITLRPIHDTGFSELIDDRNYPQRFSIWRQERDNETRSFEGLYQGRRKNTAVDGAIWLSSNGKCLVCGTETNRVSTSTIKGGSGLLIGLQLCSTHEEEAQEQSTLMNYVAMHLGGMVMFDNFKQVSASEILELACDAFKTELGCVIEKVQDQTITARRPSGIAIIVRYVSPMNYAYNVQAPNGTNLSRVDSANHHDVPYGPDHLHPDLRKSKKKIVESSFTYGNVGMDVKLIRKMVSDAEAWLMTSNQ